MLTIYFREPAAPRYIYINPDNNQVHLMVPIVGGTDIGTDNTCQSAIALQQFFGKNAGAHHEKKSALDELGRYLRALQFDISMMEVDTPLKRRKQERAIQIQNYITQVQIIQSRAELNSLSGAFPSYPAPVQELLSRRNNIYSMVLHPRYPDSYLRSVNPVFSVDRTGAQRFYHDLTRAYAVLEIPPQQSPKDRLIHAALNALPSARIDFAAIQATLTTQTQALFGVTVDFNQDNTGAPLTKDYIDLSLGGPSESVSDYVETLINCCAGTLWDTLPTSPFIVPNTQSGKETLSIVTQFFLGQVNIYCYANQLSLENFGRIIDGNAELSRQIPQVAKRALETGQSVEAALFGFINTNQRLFHLVRPLQAEEMTNIQRRFTSQYITIKDSPHFDEFMVFDSGKLGNGLTHQGAICIDLSNLTGTALFQDLDTPDLRQARELSARLPRVTPHKNEFVRSSYEMDEEQLSAQLLRLIQTEGGIDSAIELLLSETSGGLKIFQRLDERTKQALMHAPLWNSLKSGVAIHIDNPGVQELFNAQFPTETVQVTITAAMANAIRVAAIELWGPEICPDAPTVDHLQRMIPLLISVDNISVERSAGNGFVLSLPRAKVEPIQTLINQNINRVYLSPDMARTIYTEVTEHFGEQSEEIIVMNRLVNTGEVPNKLIEALRLAGVHIEPANITFPANGYNGYVLTAPPAVLQTIANIQHHRSRFHLTPVIAAALYRRVDQLGLGAELMSLNNIAAPNKIRRALQLLNIPHTNLSFNGANGYWLTVSTEIRQQLLGIGSGREVTFHPAAGGFARRSRFVDDENPFQPIGVHAMRRVQPIGDVASAAAATPEIAMQRVLGFNAMQEANPHPDLVQLNCPDSILQSFRSLMQGTRVLGSLFTNPYTGEVETFPQHVAELTSRHLQILARTEQDNTTGVMNVALYQGLLNEDQVARLRCLVKATTIAGAAIVVATGGYGCPRAPVVPPQRMIIIDQAGLQWQGDLKNSGGMFFYPSGAYSASYQTWQREMFQAMYGYARPAEPSANSILVRWLGGEGRLDLTQLTQAIKVEFSQALDAAVSQGNLALAPDEQIHFRFLKAGMGFFASGLTHVDFVRFEHARLLGIEQALQQIATLSEPQRQVLLGKVRSIELPFSGECRGQAIVPPEINQTLLRISAIVGQLGMAWAGAGRTDALAPKPGFVIATTNCGDPHAMIGNEGGYSSVDAAISSNAQVNHLNPCFNRRMQRRSSPDFVAVAPAPIMPVAPALGQFGMLASQQPRRVPQFSDQMMIRQIISHFCPGIARGSWLYLNPNPVIEVGVGHYSGNFALATPQVQVELQAGVLVILDKQNRYQAINDVGRQQTILRELLNNIPARIRDIAIAELQAQSQERDSQQAPARMMP